MTVEILHGSESQFFQDASELMVLSKENIEFKDSQNKKIKIIGTFCAIIKGEDSRVWDMKTSQWINRQ